MSKDHHVCAQLSCPQNNLLRRHPFRKMNFDGHAGTRGSRLQTAKHLPSLAPLRFKFDVRTLPSKVENRERVKLRVEAASQI